jgi:uncharacterized protein with PQ loop repeat
VLIQAMGWVAAAFAATLALPQVVRLLRTKATDGISAVTWQILLSANLAWCGHGLHTGHANIWVPNLIFFLSSATVLVQLSRHGDRNLWALFLPGLGLGALNFGIDVSAGPVAFAAAAFLPAAVAQLTQLRALVVSPNIRGVSMVFLSMNVVNQCLWVSWGLAAGEPSVTLVGFGIGTLMAINLIWAALRRTGVVRARLSLMAS